MQRHHLLGVVVAITACACGSSGATTGGADAATEAAPPLKFTSCHDTPPAGFKPPVLPKYSGAACPTIAPTPRGSAMGFVPPENDIASVYAGTSNMRQFKVVTPQDIQPGEKLPVVFLWFWLGGSAQNFIDRGDVVNAAQQQRFIAVVPEAKMNGTSSTYLFKWPFDVTSASHLPEEFTFFDDMLACVAEQFPDNANASCVSSAGVSAGALFTDQLVPARFKVLASFLSLSGGVSGPEQACSLGSCLEPWTKPAQPVPAMVLWGGMCDQCVVIDFQPASHNLETALTAEDSFFVECEHNCEHAQPPFDAPPGMTVYAAFWDFVYDHPKWLPPGESPYKTKGLPPSFPSWCSTKGKGTAVQRVGACGPPACPSTSTTGPCASTAPADSGAD